MANLFRTSIVPVEDVSSIIAPSLILNEPFETLKPNYLLKDEIYIIRSFSINANTEGYGGLSYSDIVGHLWRRTEDVQIDGGIWTSFGNGWELTTLDKIAKVEGSPDVSEYLPIKVYCSGSCQIGEALGSVDWWGNCGVTELIPNSRHFSKEIYRGSTNKDGGYYTIPISWSNVYIGDIY